MIDEASFYSGYSKLFASWFRVKIGMGLVLCGCLANLVMSGILSASENPSSIKFSDYNSHSMNYQKELAWKTDVCDALPMKLLAPFSFSITYHSYTSPSIYCGWSLINTVFRCCISAVASIAPFSLFFKFSGVYQYGRSVLSLLCICHFTAFIIDTYALSNGQATCANEFAGTIFYNSDVSITCNASAYAPNVIIDLILSVMLLTLQSSWALVKDFYGGASSGVPTALAVTPDAEPANKRSMWMYHASAVEV